MRKKSNSTPSSSRRLSARSGGQPRSTTRPKRNPHCARWPARRDLNRRDLPARRHRRKHVLLLVKEFLETGKRQLAGDTARLASSSCAWGSGSRPTPVVQTQSCWALLFC